MIETKGPYLEKILELVREKRNLDFSQYRENLLGRRVMARVRLTKRDNFEQYLVVWNFKNSIQLGRFGRVQAPFRRGDSGKMRRKGAFWSVRGAKPL